MYLYNGHRAPGLPVYDPAELPYGLIVSANADNTALILMLCVNRPYYGTNPSDSTKTGVYNTGRMKVYTCTDTEDAWTFSMETNNPLTANDDDPGGGVLWTLDDILKSDGSVWMAGTQPVPERVSEAWVRSFQEGLALGLTGAPLPYTGTAEPVAYLYNGVRLPPLPVVEGRPKAYMTKHTAFGITRYRVHFLSEPYYAVSSDGQYAIGHRSGDVDYTAKVNDTEWVYQTVWEQNGVWAAVSDVLWANFDILDESGAVVLAASNPVPVYE